MLDQLLSDTGGHALLSYMHTRETQVAVLLPGAFSLAALVYYTHARRISLRLMGLWWLALPISYLCATWVITPETESLYIYSAFSVACLCLSFKRICVPPVLTFALTFVSLLSVDLLHALTRALMMGTPLETFYWGVGGAGIKDSLFIVPALTAVMVAYAQTRIRLRGEALLEL
ncbi:MAG: hypothetical protein KIS79_18080 [Burkholderiales bacterium]|nr:hypothetical protein [Burkholderiales bacterium]